MRKRRHGQERAVLAVLKPRSGASWPDRTKQWRRAAIAGDTRRSRSGAGRPPNGLIQFVTVKLAEPDDAFCNDGNFMTNGFQRKHSTSKLQYNVLATIFIQGSRANSQQK